MIRVQTDNSLIYDSHTNHGPLHYVLCTIFPNAGPLYYAEFIYLLLLELYKLPVSIAFFMRPGTIRPAGPAGSFPWANLYCRSTIGNTIFSSTVECFSVYMAHIPIQGQVRLALIHILPWSILQHIPSSAMRAVGQQQIARSKNWKATGKNTWKTVAQITFQVRLLRLRLLRISI